MRYLVFDFETTGVGKDAARQYRPYEADRMPLPRENFPVELAATLLDADGRALETYHTLIQGAERLDPWVLDHCAHLSVKACERDGVPFAQAMRALARMVAASDEEPCTLVAHNMQYDWDEVIVRTVAELQLQDDDSYKALKGCPRFCTCVNKQHKRERSAYYFAKIGKWIGPSLQKLAARHGVEYSATDAHGAAYDVDVTAQCLRRMLAAGPLAGW
jgi:DNA polymerase III epsilon subunit-like protein